MTLNRFGLDFHHLGLAVSDPQAALSFLEALGYRRGTPVFDPLQRVNLALCEHAHMPDIELVWPGDDSSPIDRLVRDGGGLYHLCYTAADPDASLAEMERNGLEILEVSPPTPALLFSGSKVSFHCVAGFGLIEILEHRQTRPHSLASIG